LIRRKRLLVLPSLRSGAMATYLDNPYLSSLFGHILQLFVISLAEHAL